MPSYSKTFKPKAPSKRGYAISDEDKKRQFEYHKKKLFKELFKDEPYLLKKYLQ